MGLFGPLDVRLDPWQVEYGSELQLDTSEEQAANEEVSLDVELPPGEWRAIGPTGTAPDRLVFVDGVRRLEARLVVRRGERIAHGAFGGFAVGAVTVVAGTAVVSAARVDRVVVVGSGEVLPVAVIINPSLAWRPVSTPDTTPDGPLAAIQAEMRAAEEALARESADAANTLVVADGPLTFEESVRGAAVGYVKRLFRLYLPPDRLSLVRRLAPGERTPLFALRGTRRFARYSWFLRLARPHGAESDTSGIVRLEVSTARGVEAARRLADATAVALPRFVPGRGRDPRSPQNLLPIGALESHLRRQLGDARLLRRWIEDLLAREVAHA